MTVPITPTLCTSSFEPGSGGPPCPKTGALILIRDSAQELFPPGTPIEIDFDEEGYAIAPTTTNLVANSITIGAPGTYFISVTVTYEGNGAAFQNVTTDIVVNGSPLGPPSQTITPIPVAGTVSTTLFASLFLNTDDVVTVEAILIAAEGPVPVDWAVLSVTRISCGAPALTPGG